MKLITTLFFMLTTLVMSAQTLQKIPAEKRDSVPVAVITPIGEVSDTAYIQAVVAQEKEPLKISRWMVITKYYLFQDSSLNKPFSQTFTQLTSPLYSSVSKKTLTLAEFNEIQIFFRQIPKPK